MQYLLNVSCKNMNVLRLLNCAISWTHCKGFISILTQQFLFSVAIKNNQTHIRGKSGYVFFVCSGDRLLIAFHQLCNHFFTFIIWFRGKEKDQKSILTYQSTVAPNHSWLGHLSFCRLYLFCNSQIQPHHNLRCNHSKQSFDCWRRW